MFKSQAANARCASCRKAGFSAFELVIAILIISALAAVLLNRAIYYKEMAEKAAMESTVRLVKTGLQIRLAELIVTNRQAEAARLETEDPFQWLDDKPPNYAGSYQTPPNTGKWYFDANERQLVYVVNSANRLDVDSDRGAKQIRFRARLLKDRLQLYGTEVESVSGVVLVPVNPYRWR